MRRLYLTLLSLWLLISAGMAQIPGDVNGDCCVNDNDLLIALFQFGSTGSNLQGDANDDGTVDDLDLLIILFNFGLCDVAILNPPAYIHVGEQFTLTATSCASGTLSWSVQQPSNQVQPTVGSGSTFNLTAQHASNARNDVLVRLTYDDGNGNQIVRQHRITVVELDLDIFKPKVIDTNEAEIPEGDEITVGAQTWVNLDNDDRDDKFDTGTTDTDVAGENEMCKIRVRLKPNNLNAGQVALEAYGGASTIKVWKQINKGTELAMPGNLSLASDFTVSGDFLEATLWVEGIVAHTTQRQAKIKATYTLAPNKDDRVALTVLGIKSMAWLGKTNGFTAANNNHNSDTLDACPNFPTGGGNPGSNRVLPDARRPDFAVAKNKVDLEVELTVAPITDVKVYLRSFDCDDPSSETSFIDPNDGAGPEANYPGTTIPYTVQEDNRGDVGGLKAGKLNGQDGQAIASVTFTSSDTKKKIEFETAQHPGDNYRVVANGDREFLRTLRNRDRLDGFRITDPQVAGDAAAREVREASKYTSNVLVVWRLLHVENDSMVAVPAAGAQRNTIAGNITAITGAGAVATQVTTSVNLKTGPPGGQDDSPNLSSGTPQNGRFENGTITIGTGGGATATNALTGNGDTFVRKAAGISIPFTITRAGQANVTGNIVALAGTTFTLNITGGALVNGHNGGTITVAGVAMTINGVNVGAKTVSVAALNNIPFTLSDDDAFVLPDNVNLAGLNTAFNPAYIWAVADGGGGTNNDQTVPFLLNIAGNDNFVNAYEPNRGSKNNETDLFWVVYVVSAYQPETFINLGGGSFTGDGDSASEGVTRGIVIGATSNTALAQGGNGALIFRECVRDSGVAVAIYRRIVAHEVGHQFGLSHATELMTSSASDPAATDNFEDRHVNLIRSRVKSPGQP